MGRKAWILALLLLAGCAFAQEPLAAPEPSADPIEALPAVMEEMIYTGKLRHSFSYETDRAHPFPAAFQAECQKRVEAVTAEAYNEASQKTIEYTGFYQGISYNYSYTSLPSGEILKFVCTVTLKTEETEEGLRERLAYCEEEAADIIAQLQDSGTLTDDMDVKEQALALYRYVDGRLAYDTSYSNRTLYETLTENTAVCEGYAALFSALCHQLEIPVVSVYGESEGKSHVWNALDWEGERYYMDVTWGDPLPDREGYSEEKWFWLTWEELTALDPGRAITRTGSLEPQ